MSSQISTKANQDTQNTKLDTLHTDLATIDGHVDGLETLVAATNTKLDTLHADVPALNVAQNSSTSGQNGPLVQTATTTAAPTYTTAKTNPLSTDTAGNLRVSNLTATPAGSAIIGKVGIDQTTPGTTNGVQVNAALPAGTNLIGKFGIDQTTPGTTNGVQVAAALPTGTNSIGQVTSNAGTNTSTANLDVALSTRLKPADTLAGVTTVGAVTSITNALPAGSALIGKVGIDQTTPGTTNKVSIGTDGTVAVTNLDVALSTRLKPADTLTGVTTVTNLSQMSGAAIAMGTGTRNAGTQRVTIATDDVVPVTNANLDVALSTRLKPADTLTGVTTVGTVTTVTAVTSITNALPAGTNRIGSVRPVDSADADLTAAKGSQTSRALGTQDLKDSGRTAISFYALGVASGTTTTETAITMTKSAGTAATTSATSFVVTSGKKFRIIQISVATRGNVTATAQVTTFSLRVNAAGAVTTSSTPIVFSARSATPATALAWDRVILPLPEGYEIAGDGTLQIGMTANSVFTTNAPTWDVNIIGYEY